MDKIKKEILENRYSATSMEVIKDNYGISSIDNSSKIDNTDINFIFCVFDAARKLSNPLVASTDRKEALTYFMKNSDSAERLLDLIVRENKIFRKAVWEAIEAGSPKSLRGLPRPFFHKKGNMSPEVFEMQYMNTWNKLEGVVPPPPTDSDSIPKDYIDGKS